MQGILSQRVHSFKTKRQASKAILSVLSDGQGKLAQLIFTFYLPPMGALPFSSWVIPVGRGMLTGGSMELPQGADVGGLVLVMQNGRGTGAGGGEIRAIGDIVVHSCSANTTPRACGQGVRCLAAD